MDYFALVIICVAGAMLQATIGFGFPIFAMFFLVRLFPFATAVTICQFAGTIGVGFFFFKYFKEIRWTVLLPFLIPAMIIGIFFTWYSSKLQVTSLKIGLGFVLILIAIYLFFCSGRLSFPPSKLLGYSMGTISGVLNGVFAMGGPPVALYLLPALGNKTAYIACANAYFFIFKIFSLPIRFSNGSVSIEQSGFLVISLVSMTVGTIVGDKVMNRINETLLKKLVYLYIGISGIIIIFQEIF
jgi:uncharacterized membrane protein YfcA